MTERANSPRLPCPGKTFSPERLTVASQAFDAAWNALCDMTEMSARHQVTRETVNIDPNWVKYHAIAQITDPL